MTVVVVTTKGFDVVLVAHVAVAVASLVALAVLRSAAGAATRGGDVPASAARSFTGRRELAGRVVHLVPVSGFALLALSRGAYGASTGFVAVGIALWLAAAAALEGVGFPAQRRVAAALRAGTDPVADARRLASATEVAALALVVAAVVMVVGTL